MKFVVLGTSQFTLTCTKVLLQMGVEVQALISLPANERQLDSIDLEAFAREHGIGYHEFSDLAGSLALTTLRSYKPDYIFSSWPHLLKKETLEIPRRFVIGSHPAALPYNRGRHPLYWLFCLGFEETKISFFVVDEKVDNGAILSQISFQIPHDQDIAAAFSNMSEAAKVGMAEVITKLRNPEYTPEDQDTSKANYWRKRSMHDVILDPRMSASMVIRTVRSYAPPYPGAILVWKGHFLRIAVAEIDDLCHSPEEVQRMEQGKVCGLAGNVIHLKCDDHVVRLELTETLPNDLVASKYVHPPTYYLAVDAHP
jgi:methionyl-tRNA formyltransferase